ncbi:AMP-binding protein [Vibrio sp. ZSDE26]|uniref:AMP-binding protein n=1 Tax=Vibrio amylolyticus TaxID=2847292 RepID=A0A9X2BHV9_9VIBR|nr:AMP-binding protein [Vibrio amylolyticus]MCK6264366.1 AMP-binding protein [Vibrio amylolyticus]
MIESKFFCSLSQLMNTNRNDDQTVAFSGERLWAWSQFKQDVTHLTKALQTVGAQNIALCTLDTYRFTVGFIALCYAKKTIILPGNYQPCALAELSSQYDVLLCDSTITASNTIQQLALTVPSCEIEKSAGQESNHNPSHFDTLQLNQVNVVLFTSGSSGQPKPIHKTLLQLDTEVNVLENQWGAQLANATIESTVSHQHIYGLLFRVLWPLCAGRAFNNINLEYPEQVISHCKADSVLVSSPALIKRLDEQGSTVCRAVFSSGGPLPSNAAHISKQRLGSFPWEVFGSTETGGIAFRQQAPSSQEQAWQLFPEILAELNPEGCLKLKSPYIDPSCWYQTADQCEMLDHTRFHLKGRADRIVKIEEKRVSLVEVEKRLEQLPWIEESAVIPIQASSRLTLASVIVLSESGVEKITEIGKGKFWILLRSELRQWLEPVSLPKKFRVLDEIPLNSQGKRLVAQIETLFD